MTVLFDGIASGMLLFLISVGLSVTLGLMNFVNLAHGAFAMVGGYVCVTLLNRLGLPFLLSLPLAALATAAVGVLLERLLAVLLFHTDVGPVMVRLVRRAGDVVKFQEKGATRALSEVSVTPVVTVAI